MNPCLFVFTVSMFFVVGVFVGCEEKSPPKDPTVADIEDYIENNPEVVSETARFDPEFRDDPEVDEVEEVDMVE
ncbi:MAG: hypothetical protein ACF8CQ_08895 [Rhodopirellula sp. JB044]|uniref:hypothetical protein n=1 Tax=Rhodopirellula sp. JB044 TaxID=3342844 RepID=UPI00370AC413